MYWEIPNNTLTFSAGRLVSCCFIMSRMKDMIPEINIRGEASIASVNGAGGSSGGEKT